MPTRAFAAIALSIAVWLLASTPVHADDVKVGFVNIARILQQAPQAADARERIDREFAPQQSALVALQQEIRALEDNLFKNAAVMSPGERTRQESDLRSLKRDAQRVRVDFQDDINVRRNEELYKLQRLVLDVIQELARNEKYDLVVSEGVAFASERVDITDRVISILQASFKSGG